VTDKLRHFFFTKKDSKGTSSVKSSARINVWCTLCSQNSSYTLCCDCYVQLR